MIYILELSTREKLQITEEEKVKFETNLDKNFIKIGDAIINPSFVVSITVDKEASRQERMSTTPRLPESPQDITKIGSYLKKFKPNFNGN